MMLRVDGSWFYTKPNPVQVGLAVVAVEDREREVRATRSLESVYIGGEQLIR